MIITKLKNKQKKFSLFFDHNLGILFFYFIRIHFMNKFLLGAFLVLSSMISLESSQLPKRLNLHSSKGDNKPSAAAKSAGKARTNNNNNNNTTTTVYLENGYTLRK